MKMAMDRLSFELVLRKWVRYVGKRDKSYWRMENEFFKFFISNKCSEKMKKRILITTKNQLKGVKAGCE